MDGTLSPTATWKPADHCRHFTFHRPVLGKGKVCRNSALVRQALMCGVAPGNRTVEVDHINRCDKCQQDFIRIRGQRRFLYCRFPAPAWSVPRQIKRSSMPAALWRGPPYPPAYHLQPAGRAAYCAPISDCPYAAARQPANDPVLNADQSTFCAIVADAPSRS